MPHSCGQAVQDARAVGHCHGGSLKVRGRLPGAVIVEQGVRQHHSRIAVPRLQGERLLQSFHRARGFAQFEMAGAQEQPGRNMSGRCSKHGRALGDAVPVLARLVLRDGQVEREGWLLRELRRQRPVYRDGLLWLPRLDQIRRPPYLLGTHGKLGAPQSGQPAHC